MQKPRFFHFFQHLSLAVIKEVIVCSGKQRLPGLAAEIAFNSMMAMFPAIVAMLTIIGMVGSSERVFKELMAQLSRIAPVEVLHLINNFVTAISPASNRGLLSISFVAAIWIASGAISSTMIALDHIHQIPHQYVRPFWKTKLVSLVLTIGTILLLAIASVTFFVGDLIVKALIVHSDQIVETISKRPNNLTPQLLTAWYRLSMPIALLMVALAFAFIYRFGPSRWRRGTPILPGAILATVFWAIFSTGFRLYVSNFGNFNRIYGAVGAIIVLLIWLQSSALMMLIGAQLNYTVGKTIYQKQRSLADTAQYDQQNTRKNQYPQDYSRHKSQ
ncbi:YihY/virulence factor BrkB family protein [Leptodesmis sp.]|uniref:YihY/virulence factor BrkB family protein n=1 Tax=Leptodesmis sp. TaxID=3100501 RepID=UPI0040535143